jgi:hypothetical protein
MDCTEIRPLISYYYDGEATPEERARVERHLVGCEDCRRVLAEYRVIGGDLRDMTVPAPPVGLRRDVWRAIEAQQAGVGARVFGAPQAGAGRRSQGKVVQFPGKSRAGLAGAFTNFESGWSRALTAALVVGALFIVLAVLIVLQRGTPVEMATLRKDPPIPYSDYGQVVRIDVRKDVKETELKSATSVWLLDGTQRQAVTEISKDYRSNSGAPGGTLLIKPATQWARGGTYEVEIDASNVSLLFQSNSKLGSEMIKIAFGTVANTPTPTSSPTHTRVPTATPVPPTKEPTTVAEETAVATGVPGIEPSSTPVVVASATPQPPRPTNTIVPRPSPTNKPVPPTDTPVPSATPTHPIEPTATAVESATPTPHSGTPTATATATPVKGTPTPNPPCNTKPVKG